MINSVRVEVDCSAGFTTIYTVPVGKTLVVSGLFGGVSSVTGSATGQIRVNGGLTLGFGFGGQTGSKSNDQMGMIFRAGEQIEVALYGTGTKVAMLCGELVDQA